MLQVYELMLSKNSVSTFGPVSNTREKEDLLISIATNGFPSSRTKETLKAYSEYFCTLREVFLLAKRFLSLWRFFPLRSMLFLYRSSSEILSVADYRLNSWKFSSISRTANCAQRLAFCGRRGTESEQGKSGRKAKTCNSSTSAAYLDASADANSVEIVLQGTPSR